MNRNKWRLTQDYGISKRSMRIHNEYGDGLHGFNKLIHNTKNNTIDWDGFERLRLQTSQFQMNLKSFKRK